MGSISFPVIAASAVAVGVAAAVASNSGGKSLPQPVRLTPKCNGSDQLSNNVCIGTRTESVVTVTGTGTSTTTTTVPVSVTFTYAPTLG
jgi:UDP-N-acetylmuramyl tripeptide synthase